MAELLLLLLLGLWALVEIQLQAWQAEDEADTTPWWDD